MLNLYNINYIIKYVYFLFSYTYIFFIDYIYINTNNREIINIDNEFKFKLYENDINYINYNTKFKPIAFYYPEYNNFSFYKYFNNSSKNFHLNEKTINSLIQAQIKLAKNHKIYGFAIYYNPFKFDKISRITINSFLNEMNFPFFLIWKNDDIDEVNNIIIDYLIKHIRKFMIRDNYIKIDSKPVLSINNPYNLYSKINIISYIRKLAEKEIGKLFILYPFKGNYTKRKFLENFDGIYDFSNLDLFEEITNRPNIVHYSGFIYKNILLNDLNINYTIFRTCFLNHKNYKDYTPEKFYIQSNIIFQSQQKLYKKNKGFIFIDSWNDFLNGNYLEFDEKFGYSSINSFTKSLLNLSYCNNSFRFSYNYKTTIAIQIHVFYKKQFTKIIKRLNLIPIKYDLFISTTSTEKKSYIEKCLSNSNHNNYEIKIYENKGRDIYPFITQMRNHFKYYKYICHLHTKESKHKKNLGSKWGEYLYKNLIGSREIISNIIDNFENNEKLGFIFPESYYEIIKGVKDFENMQLSLHANNKQYMNFILSRVFHKYKIGDKLIFPIGNMFWSKIKAIFQVFKLKLNYPDESGQLNFSIMHAIERIWLYFVKLNGYYYKCIFKYY